MTEGNCYFKETIRLKTITVISGSPSKTSRIIGVLDYVVSKIKEQGISVTHLQVCDLPAADLIYANFNSEEIKKANAIIEQSDALIIATPVYKASFTGVLKTFLDLIPQKGLENKKILPLVMGGTTAHLLMIEYSLKPVLSVLGATTIEQGVFIEDKQVAWNSEGKVTMTEEINNRLNESLQKFLESSSITVTN